MHAILVAAVEVNEVKSKSYMLPGYICQGCRLPPMLYVGKNLVLRRIMLLATNIMVAYLISSNDVSVFVMSNAGIEEVSKEIQLHETITGANINLFIYGRGS